MESWPAARRGARRNWPSPLSRGGVHSRRFRRPLHSAFVAQIRQRMREYDPRVSSLRLQVETALAAAGTTPEDVVRSEHQRQATDQVSTGNTITSLRLASTLDWSRFVERVSTVEEILRRDPAAVYPRMDFQSRDRYRHVVEEIARAERRGAGARRPAGRRERPPGCGAEGDRRIAPRTSAIT